MSTKTTSERVLFHLKTHGSATAKDIADAFAMTPMGAHKVLQGLCDDGLVQFADVAGGRGRPTRRFRLTAAGHKRFPDRHAEIAVDMISDIKKLFGQEGLDRLIAAREKDQIARYGAHQPAALADRVQRLAELRDAEGYMARIERDEEDLLLIEDHCPICAAAETCQGFCRSELNIFRMVLGEDVDISREEHLLDGGRRCTYRIRAL